MSAASRRAGRHSTSPPVPAVHAGFPRGHGDDLRLGPAGRLDRCDGHTPGSDGPGPGHAGSFAHGDGLRRVRAGDTGGPGHGEGVEPGGDGADAGYAERPAQGDGPHPVGTGHPGNRTAQRPELPTAPGPFTVARAMALTLCCTLALLLTAGAQPTAHAAARPAADGPVLPQVPEALPDSSQCVKPARRTIRQTPWAAHRLGLSELHPLGTGSGVTVAVLDSGLTTDGVTQLQGRVTGAEGKDCAAHGTFLAGLVAAGEKDGSGFAGVAPEARITAHRVTAHSGTTSAAALAAQIRRAVDDGARVVLIGAPARRDSSALRDAVAHAGKKNALVVAPARLPGTHGGPAHPAGGNGVLSVAAVDTDGRVHPRTGNDGSTLPEGTALLAPGAAVIGVGPGGGHFTSSGDTVAAAFTAGAAAVVLSRSPQLTADAVQHRLLTTSLPEDEDTAHNTPAEQGGSAPSGTPGRLDPVGAASAVSATENPASRPRAAGAQDTYRTDPRPAGVDATAAWAGVGALLLLTLLVAAAAVLVPLGKARSWRRPSPHAPAHTQAAQRRTQTPPDRS